LKINHDKIYNEEIDALNNFIVNNRPLFDLEKKIGSFNIFRTLKFEYGELRHSNVLSWLFQPEESHGLGELFLRRWLMKIVLDIHDELELSIDPVTIDSMQITSVEVYREWKNLDILIIIETLERVKWIVVIENKINSTQYHKQLEKYKDRIHSYFPSDKNMLFVFLSKNNEIPQDNSYVTANYQQVYEILNDCVSERKDTIGPEPLVLINHYLEILSEVFMENSEVAELARQIYKNHKRALDVIFEHKPDILAELSAALNNRLLDQSSEMDITNINMNKGLIRFIPNIWRTEENLKGTAWGKENSAFAIVEINLWTKSPRFTVVLGAPPMEWGKQLWEISREAPFKNTKRSKMPATWFILHSVPMKLTFDHLNDDSLDDYTDRIYGLINREMEKTETKEIFKIVQDQLPDLSKHL